MSYQPVTAGDPLASSGGGGGTPYSAADDDDNLNDDLTEQESMTLSQIAGETVDFGVPSAYRPVQQDKSRFASLFAGFTNLCGNAKVLVCNLVEVGRDSYRDDPRNFLKRTGLCSFAILSVTLITVFATGGRDSSPSSLPVPVPQGPTPAPTVDWYAPHPPPPPPPPAPPAPPGPPVPPAPQPPTTPTPVPPLLDWSAALLGQAICESGAAARGNESAILLAVRWCNRQCMASATLPALPPEPHDTALTFYW